VARDVNGEVVDVDVPMGPGDVALFFTDGATEAMSASGEMFGDARLVAAFEEIAAAELPLPAAVDALFARVSAFRARQDDDVTMMLVRRTGAAVERNTAARSRFVPMLA